MRTKNNERRCLPPTQLALNRDAAWRNLVGHLQLLPPMGLGLISMEERVRLLGGNLSIDSKSDAGVKIHVRLPLPEKAGQTTKE